MRLLIGIVPLAILVSPANAESSLHAKEAQMTWAAFRCATLASVVGSAEYQRLFDIGRREGTKYIKAINEDATLEIKIYSDVPEVLRGKIGGISQDFDLGRLYEATSSGTVDNLKEALSSLEPIQFNAAMTDLATQKFESDNCALLK